MISISVLVPAHNAADTLLDALDCLTGQEGFGNDLEILVADDGSTDQTLTLAQTAGYRDPRIRILGLPRAGLVSTLNAALKRSRGRFIARMDADDLCSEDRLRRQLRYMGRHPQVDVVGTGVRMFPSGSVTPNMERYVSWQNGLLTHRALERNLLVESPLTHATALFRRESLERIGGWREVDGPEDLDLWLRGAAAGWRFGKVNRVLYHWRESPRRVTRTDSRLSREAFRRLAMDAFAANAPRSVLVHLWGWGRSLEDWNEGLRGRGFPVRTLELSPRTVRQGEPLPSLPDPNEVQAFAFSPAVRQATREPRSIWLLAYGTEPSRESLCLRLRKEGYRPGRHYRFVS
jgi:glycosyltransferase involved in cell wall biosynthesis